LTKTIDSKRSEEKPESSNNSKEEEMLSLDFDLDQEIRKKQYENEEENEKKEEKETQLTNHSFATIKTINKTHSSSNVIQQHIPHVREWTPQEIDEIKSNYALYVSHGRD
jgi:hypothetical protein